MNAATTAPRLKSPENAPEERPGEKSNSRLKKPGSVWFSLTWRRASAGVTSIEGDCAERTTRVIGRDYRHLSRPVVRKNTGSSGALRLAHLSIDFRSLRQMPLITQGPL